MLNARWWCIGILLIGAGAFWVTRPVVDQTIIDAGNAAQVEQPEITLDEPAEQRVVSFCSACHAMPVASSFTRDAWHEEVMQGYHFYAKSGRSDLDPPPPAQAIAYFRQRASHELQFSKTADAAQPFGVTFREESLPIDSRTPVPPAIAFLKWVPGDSESNEKGLIAADMRLGTIHRIGPRFNRSEWGRFGNPCHVEVSDLDRDGHRDLVVADLGSFDPDDHDRGRVLWCPWPTDRKTTPVALATGLGRVADVRPGDVDGDGDLDLVVAEFGWHRTGGIHLLWNDGTSKETMQFRKESIYRRPGTIHVPVTDIDGDGRPDVVVLVSQEYERVELLLNRGRQPWEIRTVWAAPDPAFGMSGLELVDLDRDGDQDLLFTNGDTFDSLSVKPSHGIQWLRNDGNLNFTYQRIADLPGVYRAIPADFDGDGDLDLVASVWLPRQSIDPTMNVKTMPALVVYEQARPLEFERHTLQRGLPCFASVEVADFDQDGDLDIATGWFLSSLNQSSNWISIWWNEKPK